MSIRIWEDIASQKKQVEDQREEILNAFKQRKVADELGQVKAEKLFKPITKLLAPEGEKPEEEHEDEDLYANFDHDLFEEGDIGNEMQDLFDDGQELLGLEEGVGPKYVKDIPLPESDEEELPEKVVLSEKAAHPAEKPPRRWRSSPNLPSYYEVFPKRKKKESESVYLSTLEKFLKKKDPAAVLTMGEKQLSYSEAEKAAYEIYASRAQQVLEGQNIGKKKLGPFTGKSRKEMRQMLKKEMTGKGAKQAEGFERLIPRLSLGISSIFAGNTSVKLREEMKVIAQLLYQAGIISSEQKNKVLSL